MKIIGFAVQLCLCASDLVIFLSLSVFFLSLSLSFILSSSLFCHCFLSFIPSFLLLNSLNLFIYLLFVCLFIYFFIFPILHSVFFLYLFDGSRDNSLITESRMYCTPARWISIFEPK